MNKKFIASLISACLLTACSKTDDVIFGPDPIGQISMTSEKFASMAEKDRRVLFAYVAHQMPSAPQSVVGRSAAEVLADARAWEAGRGDAEKIKVAETDLSLLSQALRLYRLDVGSFPTQQESLRALVTRPSETKAHVNWRKDGYLVTVPTDPWGNDYQYTSEHDTQGVTVSSLGSDKLVGGVGPAADIILEVQ